MTEVSLPVTAQITPLAEYLSGLAAAPVVGRTHQTPALRLASYLGALTPQNFSSQGLDVPRAETAALLAGAAVHDAGWLRRVAVRGEDRYRWLSGMVTNAVEGLADQTGAYNLILNAQGRIQGDVHVWKDANKVWRSEDDLELELTAEQSEALLAHLDHFIIMDDVELFPILTESAIGLSGPLAEKVLHSIGLPSLDNVLTSTVATLPGAIEIPVRVVRAYGTIAPRYHLWAPAEQIPALWELLIAAGATAVGAASLEALRVAEGIPAYGIDIASRDLAQETSQVRGLSFTKGCYLGQEIVERVRSRGQVHRHLRSLEIFPNSLALPAVGTEFATADAAADSKPAATLTSVASLELDGARRVFAIAMVRAEAEVGSRPLVYADGTAQILNAPPTFTSALKAAEEMS
jgi:folate-binding protein YgfZ